MTQLIYDEAGAVHPRIAQAHRIGRAHVVYVMTTVEAVVIPADGDADERFFWIGEDERGRELEIVALNLPDFVLVIHVMPTAFRGGQP